MVPMAIDWPETTRPDAPLSDLLTLEEIDRDLYRATTVFEEPHPLYGGQVAAQALLAAGGTVPEGRLPHSLHGYYLRGGDTRRPTIFKVDRDRDGRSFSARRVVAVQGGEVIFNMSASFQVVEDGEDHQVDRMPEVEAPEGLTVEPLPRLTSVDGAIPSQPPGVRKVPSRFWARCTQTLPDDPLLHAAVLAYVSDTSSGLSAIGTGEWARLASIDHAIWFHRHLKMDDWNLVELRPHTTGGGRGWYSGSVFSRDGVLGASLVQESLFRTSPPPG
jgi:acyl-CoA thioesterase-2